MTDTGKAYLYLLITFLAWGSLYVVSKFVLGKIAVITISFFRYAIAGSVLFLVLKRSKRKAIEKQDHKYIFLIGFWGYSVAIALQLLGTKLSSASLAALVNSVNPVVIMLFAVIILKERLTSKKGVCAFLAMAGVYLVIGRAAGDGQGLGIAVSVISVILWSWISVLVRKITQKYDALQITTYGIIVAAVCTMPFSMAEIWLIPMEVDGSAICAILYMGLVCTALSHFLWNKSLSVLEAGTCSLFYPLQPLTAVFLGWMFLGEVVDVYFAVGAILIISGVFFTVIGKPEVAAAKKTAIQRTEQADEARRLG